MSTTTDERTRRANSVLGGGDDVRRVEKSGREYLAFPVVAAREMVMNYPEFGRREFLPQESFEKTADLWAGQPVTARHPRENTAKSPDAYASETYGQVHAPEAEDGRLRFNEVLIDVEKANALGGTAQRVVDRLESGEQVAVSTGYDTVGDAHESGTYDGESYDLVQGDVIPDHLAVFPPDEYEARCSLEDGCGAPRANAVADEDLQHALGSDAGSQNAMDDDPIHPSTVQRVLSLFNWDDENVARANAEEAHDDCGCGGVCDDCGESEPETTDPDGGDTSDDTDMPDNDIDTLAERTSFSAEQLQSWEDEELDALEETIETTVEDGGEEEPETTEPETADDPTPEADGGEAETATAGADKENAEPPEWAQRIQSELTELKENYVQDEYEEEIRTVTNALDMSEDAARDLADNHPEELERLADEHGESRANYGGLPGPVDRTPDESSAADDYPAPGRDFAGGDD